MSKELMKKLEKTNWNENGSEFHVFNSQEELLCYIDRSKNGKWWRDEYGRHDFEQCVFKFPVTQWVNVFESNACFKNAVFKENVTFNKAKFKENADFDGCRFSNHVNFSNCIFEEQFYPGSFDNSVNFSYAKFKNHVTFWRTNFEKYADFSYSKFEKGVSYEESFFHDEFIFHNAEIHGDAHFEAVEFKGKVNSWNLYCFKNISFKWANFRQKANFSGLNITDGFADFHGTNFEKNAYFYSGQINEIDLTKSVIEKSVYFLDSEIKKANRETWRIIKHEFIRQSNKIESLNYHALEMMEYEKELFGVKKELRFSLFRLIRDFYQVFQKGNRTNKFVIFINRLSNGFNLLPFRGVVFTLISTLFFYLIFIYFVIIENNLELDYSAKHIGVNFRQALQFLNITDWKYYPFNLKYDWAYGVLFLGRIVIGYGIYQTVQAFRKFGSS
ncbi:pentapeptide repeat-containing protein [Flavobacterium johnsoniae]|uniref:Pentapeptide repeat-containing protein n=1 Tax=Flavobacterium johnsoniae TaxID=986 RepID=A0A1J7BSM3_FLAJO|nr:pentapeptide repeat-containing protein [Flavobacterium johnsoniae]OIV41703.1 hypothetical protein BKM63_14400 [Flavobacterium johnsoniae]